MKILVLGDIHGKIIWEDIIDKENPDKTVFLGDYVCTHDNISSEQQLSNLEDILNYKEKNSDKVILLRGNHDVQHLGYYWARCSGFDQKVGYYMAESNFKERFLKLTQWIHIDDDLKVIFSHAGISSVWINNSNINSRCGCPKCSESKGEREIEQWLIKNKIKYIHPFVIENIPKDIRTTGIIKPDFYLPSYNLIIEYNGI